MAPWVAAIILLSAGTYLFDFGSNMVVAVQYGQHYTSSLRLQQKKLCNDQCRRQTSELAGYFWGMVGVLVFSHTLNALIFNFKFKKKDDPLRAAYFLPLIQLWRLLNLFWRTLSCKGARDLRSEEMNGLFSILGTSFEGMPLLILQFSAYLVQVRAHVFIHDISIVFKVSVAASLLSATYNGGSSVQSVADNAKTFKQRLGVALAAGLFTLFASLARCLTYSNIMVHMRAYFQRNRTERSRARYHASDTIPVIFLVVNITSYWLYYWLLHFPKAFSKRLGCLKTCLASFVFGYMSIIVGPLYPMVSESKDMGELGTSIFQHKLVMVAIVNLLVDISVASVTYWMGTLPTPYLVTSLLAAAGYVVSVGCYIKSDRDCGPLLVSSPSNRRELEVTEDVENSLDGTTTVPAETSVDIPMVLDSACDDLVLDTREHLQENPKANQVEAEPLIDIIRTESDVKDAHGCGLCSRSSSQRQANFEVQSKSARQINSDTLEECRSVVNIPIVRDI